jgi:hypothetical protein
VRDLDFIGQNVGLQLAVFVFVGDERIVTGYDLRLFLWPCSAGGAAIIAATRSARWGMSVTAGNAHSLSPLLMARKPGAKASLPDSATSSVRQNL